MLLRRLTLALHFFAFPDPALPDRRLERLGALGPTADKDRDPHLLRAGAEDLGVAGIPTASHIK